MLQLQPVAGLSLPSRSWPRAGPATCQPQVLFILGPSNPEEAGWGLLSAQLGVRCLCCGARPRQKGVAPTVKFPEHCRVVWPLCLTPTL